MNMTASTPATTTAPITVRDAALEPIAEKVHAGVRLSGADGLTLLTTRDIWGVGALAHAVRTRLHGDAAYYNVNRHINYSNVCALSCKFCEFHRKRGMDGAYEDSVDEVVTKAKAAAAAGATELHIVGGLNPYLPFDYYTRMMAEIKAAVPGVHIKAFTAVEVVHLCRISKRAKDLGLDDAIRSVLSELKDAGLGSLPGGGAEVFDDRVHDEAYKGKIRSDQWLRVHEIAHELGLMTNATMLYGHIEKLEDRVHHFELLRQAQDKAIADELPGRFQCLIPLPFFPDGSELQHLPGPQGLENLRMIAVSRLMLDNFEHIKAFWIMQTLPMTQVMLEFGADDVDGTVQWYDITKVTGTGNDQAVSVPQLRNAIVEAGFQPIERDTLYRRVQRDGAAWRVA